MASHTDLMVRRQKDTLAIEAKWTEPRYETVLEWTERQITSMNKRNVLEGWLGLLQPHATRALNRDDFSDTIYQMVHRAASACYNAERPRLAYLHFTPDPTGKGATSTQYQSDLQHLYTLLGNPVNFNFHLIEVEIRATAAFERIKDLPKASVETARRVYAALENGPLFEFVAVRYQPIGGVP